MQPDSNPEQQTTVRLDLIMYGLMQRASGIPESLGALLIRVAFNIKLFAATRFLHQARADDVFVVSFPKAGTTVMQMMLYQLTTDGAPFRHIDDVVPWFDKGLDARAADFSRRPSPRVFKTHLPLSRLPKVGRFIYVIRDPKDSCISYFHFAASLYGGKSSLTDFLDRFLKGGSDGQAASYFGHLGRCARWLKRRRVLIVNYDDIVRRPGYVIDRVAAFCGIALSTATRERTLSRVSFEFMKANNDAFDPRRARGGGTRLNETQFIRRGVSGSWADEMSPSQAARIDEQTQEFIRRNAAFLPDELLRALHPASVPSRGCVEARIAPDADSLLWSDEAAPVGVLLRNCREPIEIGDAVRLRLRFAEKDVAVERATVTRIISDGSQRSVEVGFDVDPGNIPVIPELSCRRAAAQSA